VAQWNNLSLRGFCSCIHGSEPTIYCSDGNVWMVYDKCGNDIALPEEPF